MKKVLNIFYYIVILFLILIVGCTFINKGHPPSVFGYSFLNVSSESMEPYIEKGSLVIVKNTNVDKLNTGDVITYFLDNKNVTVTHRIVKINNIDNKKVITTKGDANNVEDNRQVTEDMIVGKVIFHIKVVGKIFIFIKKYFVFFLAAIIILYVFYLIFLKKLRINK